MLSRGGAPPPRGDHNFSSAASLARASLTSVWPEPLRNPPSGAHHGPGPGPKQADPDEFLQQTTTSGSQPAFLGKGPALKSGGNKIAPP